MASSSSSSSSSSYYHHSLSATKDSTRSRSRSRRPPPINTSNNNDSPRQSSRRAAPQPSASASASDSHSLPLQHLEPNNLHNKTVSRSHASSHNNDDDDNDDFYHYHAHESFLENPTPVEAEMAETHLRGSGGGPTPNNRDSHDLSYSNRNVTRDSLVTNMLLSLDQYSNLGGGFGPDDAYDDAPQIFDTSRSWANTVVAAPSKHHHHHQHSYSSDLDTADDSGRLSSQTSRGRRSNSSSNFHNTYTRLNSVREAGHNSKSRASSTTTTRQHTRGGAGRESRNSSLTSIDAAYAHMNSTLNQQRNPHHHHHHHRHMARSASFDQTSSSGQLDSVPSSPFQVEFANHANGFARDAAYNDAAPTPTIPSGPRRTPSTPAMLPPPPPPPSSPPQSDPRQQHTSSHSRVAAAAAAAASTDASSRKQSLSSRSVKTAPSSRRGTLTSRDAAAAHANAHNHHPPPLPTAAVAAAPAVAAAMSSPDLDSAPAPLVGYGKSKDHVPTNGNAASLPAPKEKQGFFRRVFGGGSSTKTTPESPAALTERDLEPTTSATAPPSRDNSSIHSTKPVLQKKPSSFFRRRKKSTADQGAAPPLPGNTPPVPPIAPINVKHAKEQSTTIEQSQPSPASSLREAMTPYLDRRSEGYPRQTPFSDTTNTPRSRDEDPRERGEYMRDFSPDYEPSPNARIRKVKSRTEQEKEEEEEEEDDYNTHDTPSKPSTRKPTKKQSRNSFLHLEGGDDHDEPTGAFMDRSKFTQGQTLPKSATDDTLRPTNKQNRHLTHFHNDSESDAASSRLALPIDGGKRGVSPASDLSRTDSGPPSVLIESPPIDATVKVKGSKNNLPKLNTMQDNNNNNKPLDEPEFVIGEPTEDDRLKAQQIFDGSEDFIQKGKAAGWMGEMGPIRQRTLAAYLELYDFANVSVVSSLRQICDRLVLRAETQQIDRILVAFAKRWCACNPNHGFKTPDVIHTICYSIMLLNTDLHMADIESKMTRSQFIKNTMTTLSESVPDELRRQTILPDRSGGLSPDTATEPAPKSFRHSFRPPPRTDTQGSSTSEGGYDCGPLVRKPYEGTFKGWEEQVEQVLKDTYASIRDERLPLHGAEPEPAPTPSSANNLSVMGMLKRSPSVLSKAPSEGAMSTQRGRVPEPGRNAGARWTSKSRSRPGLPRAGFASSHTSFDDQSMWSPALSSATWSKYSLGRTQGSASETSFAMSMGPRSDYHQSIGFANALSQAITRDDIDAAGSILSDELPDQLLEDESLELMGPPWIKEGMVIHKHHLDGVGKKAKERNWSEVFAVIQKGQMSLFSFTANKSQRQKTRAGMKPVVGGGNWQDNAANMGTFNLRQCLASALPSPGYSRSRPYVWALSLPTGAVHLFQVGTPEIIKEFVTTANYWSARLSVHPLVGGISNIEYGWSEKIVNNALVMAINQTNGKEPSRPPSSTQQPPQQQQHGRRSSIASGRASIRSASFDLGQRAFTHDSGRGKLPGDRVHIANWTPPTQSMRASTAREEEQLVTLAAYVQGIEEDLQAHNQLRSPMLLAFTPRGPNAGKAMHNWESKSAYLLREIVKYRTYTDCLQQAGVRRQEVDRERGLARRAARGELTEGDMEVSDGEEEEEGDVTMKA